MFYFFKGDWSHEGFIFSMETKEWMCWVIYEWRVDNFVWVLIRGFDSIGLIPSRFMYAPLESYLDFV